MHLLFASRYSPIRSGSIINGHYIPDSLPHRISDNSTSISAGQSTPEDEVVFNSFDAFCNISSDSSTDLECKDDQQQQQPEEETSTTTFTVIDELASGLERWSRIPVSAYRRRQFSTPSPVMAGPVLRPTAADSDATLLAHPRPTRKILRGAEPVNDCTSSTSNGGRSKNSRRRCTPIELDPLMAFLGSSSYYYHLDDYFVTDIEDDELIAPPPPPLLGTLSLSFADARDHCQQDAATAAMHANAAGQHGTTGIDVLFEPIDWDKASHPHQMAVASAGVSF